MVSKAVLNRVLVDSWNPEISTWKSYQKKELFVFEIMLYFPSTTSQSDVHEHLLIPGQIPEGNYTLYTKGKQQTLEAQTVWFWQGASESSDF